MRAENGQFNLEALKEFYFVKMPQGNSYASGNPIYEEIPQRSNFHELVSADDRWKYRDSYTGHSRSGGQEVITYEDVPVWFTGYGGGMIEGKENLSDATFDFLKKALATDEEGFESLRGPHELVDGDWKYTYIQEGDFTDFNGYEEISHKGERVFWHRAIGGILKHD